MNFCRPYRPGLRFLPSSTCPRAPQLLEIKLVHGERHAFHRTHPITVHRRTRCHRLLWFRLDSRLASTYFAGAVVPPPGFCVMNIESVWDYPRPPRLEAVPQRIRIVHRGVTVADTSAALRILETSHPPVYYIPPAGLTPDLLSRSASRTSYCEFKGMAEYWNLLADGAAVRDVAWSYPKPVEAYARLAGHLAFYASKVDECWVDNERVQAQDGDFYGGWITTNLRGPFKGAAGTLGW
jgi:uncharacterized protein (DUF427 family)